MKLRTMNLKNIAAKVALPLTALSLTISVGVYSPSDAMAQDLLPRDNGIVQYHTSPRYRDSESHPLRVVAYVLHPVGWILREGIFRPWSYFAGSTEFTKSFFGYREPFDYREPVCFDDIAVPDCKMMAPMNAIGREESAPSEAATMVQPDRQVFFPDINFEFNKSSLTDLGKGRVRQVAKLLQASPSVKIVVEGHTDYKGTDEYNQALGTRRAESVVKELTDLGVDAARISPISYGESKPLYTEEEDWARAMNRRVQFTVQGEGQAAPAPVAAPAAE